MYLKFLFLIVLAFSCIIASSNKTLLVLPSDQQFSISTILKDLTFEFLINHHLKFYIVTFKSIPSATKDIIDNFLLLISKKYPAKVLHFVQVPNLYILGLPMVLFFESLDDLYDFEKMTLFGRMDEKPIVYFIYIPELTIKQLEKILKFYEKLDIFAVGYFLYGFFIINEEDSVKLVTIEWFSVGYCNQAHLKVLNEFDKKTQKWQKRLEYYEKFYNYFDCELVLLLPEEKNCVLEHVSGYARMKNGAFSVHGIVPKVFELAGQVYNFLPAYQPAILHANYFLYSLHHREDIYAVDVNGTKKEPLVYFSVMSDFHFNEHIRVSHAFVDFMTYFVVTPTPIYSPYERLALPFDKETWTMLILTFSSACVTILLINYCLKSVRHTVYGKEIKTPFLNLVRIIFGITLFKVPKHHFPRFIIILFVWFCLIFRTCFQSKSFEFMTSQPRHPMPETLADLIDGNYTIISDYTGPKEVINDAKDEHGRR